MKYFTIVFTRAYGSTYDTQHEYKIKAANFKQAEAKAMKIVKRKPWYKRFDYVSAKAFSYREPTWKHKTEIELM